MPCPKPFRTQIFVNVWTQLPVRLQKPLPQLSETPQQEKCLLQIGPRDLYNSKVAYNSVISGFLCDVD